MNYMEQLVGEWLDFRGYFVRYNVRVGRQRHGGFRGEMDVAAYHPQTQHCLHVECQCDAGSWTAREQILAKKFAVGRQYFAAEVFPWLDSSEIEQWAVVWAAGRNRKRFGQARIVPAKLLYYNIAQDMQRVGLNHNRVVPEKYALLRTIQFTLRFVCTDMVSGKLAETPSLLPRSE